MAHDHRKVNMELAQGIFLLDDPGFLRQIVKRESAPGSVGGGGDDRAYRRRPLRAERCTRRPPQRPQEDEGFENQGVGTLNLAVPQDREGTFCTRLFSRYQRLLEGAGLGPDGDVYVEGVSTRKVKEVTEELCGISFSKSLVSSLAGSLDAELQAWRSRPLGAKAYPLRVRGRQLREGAGGWTGGEPRRLGRLGGARRRAAGGRRGGGGSGQHRERGDLPRAVPVTEGPRA